MTKVLIVDWNLRGGMCGSSTPSISMLVSSRGVAITTAAKGPKSWPAVQPALKVKQLNRVDGGKLILHGRVGKAEGPGRVSSE